MINVGRNVFRKVFLESQLRKMTSSSTSLSSYESAVCAINNLQSNASVLAARRKLRDKFPEKNLIETEKYLKRTGVEVEDLDKLNIIHVTGTKGKGSTCAITESILRHHGYKTGFYSSPHLVHLRERIRINGVPLSEDAFAKYFHKVYNSLKATQTPENDEMPAYFKFMTILAFHVFLEEQVDVAIVEVGIGGAFDCTNVFEKPVVCGITTLDFDHMSILGNTLEDIAWHKAGICKAGSVCVTVPQPLKALAVVCRRAEELCCPLYMAPQVCDYVWPCDDVICGIPGKQQYWNVTLALQLSKIWLSHMRDEDDKGSWEESCLDSSYELLKNDTTEALHCMPVLSGFTVGKLFTKGLESVKWPGRSQIVKTGKITYFLDGAHTPKSIQGCDFNYAVFCPTSVHNRLDPRSAQSNFTANQESEFKKCLRNQQTWSVLSANEKGEKLLRVGSEGRSLALAEQTGLTEFAELDTKNGSKTGSALNSAVFHCIEDSIKWIENCDKELEIVGKKPVQVLVTGSLHLVGGVLGLIDTDLDV